MNGKTIYVGDQSILPPSLPKAKKIVKFLGFDRNVVFLKGDFSLLENIKEKIDFAYIDIAHDYHSTCNAIDICIKKGTDDLVIFGDDFSDGITVETKWGVKRAVKEKFSFYKVHYDWFWESHKKYYQK